MVKLNAKQLRKITGNRGQVTVKKQEIYIILDNVLDTYNIGSIFRLADAVGAKKVYLCGQTPIPPNPRIKKASINTVEWVTWSYSESVVGVIREIREEIPEIQIIAIEQSPKSIQYNKFEYKLPVALIVGHETYGVSKEVLDQVDGVVEIPMFGVNISLNVMVSLAIVLYEIIEHTKNRCWMLDARR